MVIEGFEHLECLRTAAFTVVDSSFLEHGLFTCYSRITNWGGRTLLAKAEGGIIEEIAGCIGSGCLFSSEVIDEQTQAIEGLKDMAYSWTERGYPRSAPKDIGKARLELLKLVKSRYNLLGRIRMSPLEARIPLHVRKYLDGIVGAMREIAEPLADKKIASEAALGLESSAAENKLNDARVFAKAVALSYCGSRVYLLTGDKDYIEMSKRFYSDIRKYSERHGFGEEVLEPEEVVDVVHVPYHGLGVMLLRAGWHKPESHSVKEIVEELNQTAGTPAAISH